MRLQHKRFFERHLEKLLIGVALAFLAGAGVYFYRLDPISMTVGSETLGTQELENRIADKIRDLENRLRQPSRIKTIAIPDEPSALKSAMKERLSPHDSLAVGLGPPGLRYTRSSDQALVYDLPAIPPAEDPKAVAGFAVLKDVADPQQMAAYTLAIGNQVPRDFRYVLSSGTYDLGKLLQVFAGVDNAKRMPPDWYQKAMNLTDVTLERQTWDPVAKQWGAPGADGKFKPDAVEVIPLPPLCPDFRHAVDPAKRDSADDEVMKNQDEIRQQPVPPVTEVRSYQPPEAMGLSKKDLETYADLQARLTKVRQDLANLEKTVAPGPGPMMPGPGPGPGPGTGPMPPNWGGPGMLPTPPGPGSAAVNPADLEAKKKDLQNQEQLLTGKIDALLNSQSAPTTMPATGTPGRIRIRALDLTVKPGMTYRYRLVVSVLNPLFHRPGLTKDQAAKSFEVLSLVARASVWSDPVTTEPEFQVFAQNANLKEGKTGFLAYRIIGGKWESASLNALRPGQQVVDTANYVVGGVNQSFPVRMGATLVDVVGETQESVRVILLFDDGRLEERTMPMERKRIDGLLKGTEGPKTAAALVGP